MQLAARMDEAFEEQGKSAFITPDRNLIIEGETSPIAEVERNYDRVDAEYDWFLPNDLRADYRTFRFERETEGTFADESRYVALFEALPGTVEA
jgi:hypothetical protein